MGSRWFREPTPQASRRSGNDRPRSETGPHRRDRREGRPADRSRARSSSRRDHGDPPGLRDGRHDRCRCSMGDLPGDETPGLLRPPRGRAGVVQGRCVAPKPTFSPSRGCVVERLYSPGPGSTSPWGPVRTATLPQGVDRAPRETRRGLRGEPRRDPLLLLPPLLRGRAGRRPPVSSGRLVALPGLPARCARVLSRVRRGDGSGKR